jgi:hypothetical protein
VHASFDSQELLASRAELEKKAREHAPSPSSRLAEAPSAQLGIDLAAILASVKSSSASEAATVEIAARLADEPPRGKESAGSRPYRRVLAATAILIIVGSLVAGAGYLAGGEVLVGREAPPALQKFDASPETTAQAPAAEQTADGGPAAVEAAALIPTSAVKAPAAVEPPAPAAAPPKPEAVVAKPSKPATDRKKPSADKSEKPAPRSDRHAKAKPVKVAKPRRAPDAPAPPAWGNANTDVFLQAQQAVGSITGAVKGWVDSGARP